MTPITGGATVAVSGEENNSESDDYYDEDDYDTDDSFLDDNSVQYESVSMYRNVLLSKSVNLSDIQLPGANESNLDETQVCAVHMVCIRSCALHVVCVYIYIC